MHVLIKVRGKYSYFSNLSASQLKHSFRYAKEITEACMLNSVASIFKAQHRPPHCYGVLSSEGISL